MSYLKQFREVVDHIEEQLSVEIEDIRSQINDLSIDAEFVWEQGYDDAIADALGKCPGNFFGDLTRDEVLALKRNCDSAIEIMEDLKLTYEANHEKEVSAQA